MDREELIRSCKESLEGTAGHIDCKVVGKYILEYYRGTESVSLFIFPLKKGVHPWFDTIAWVHLEDYWKNVDEAYAELDSESKIERFILWLHMTGGRVYDSS